MELLPDNVMLHMFSYLWTGDLVEVRSVCRRWRELALDRAVWRARKVSASGLLQWGNDAFLARLLRVAPRVREFSLAFDVLPARDGPMTTLLRSTLCAVEHLSLELGKAYCAVLGDVLRHQAELGRLRRLTLETAVAQDANREQMLEIVSDLHLERLEICDRESRTGGTASYMATGGHWGQGSLKQLIFRGNWSDPLLKFLLTARAGSLEAVQYSGCVGSRLSVPWVSDLTQCPNLKIAVVPVVLEAAHLSKCPLLSSLGLLLPCIRSVSPELQASLAGTKATLVDFLRGATKLENMHFLACTPVDVCSSMVLDLLVAWTSSGTSGLRKLHLPEMLPGAPCVERLWGSLPGLSMLHTLVVERAPPSELLLTLTPSSAPNLSLLIVSTLCLGLTDVPNALMSSVVAAVRRNTQLHVLLSCTEFGCRVCSLFNNSVSPLGFYAHVQSRECKWHKSSADWVFVG